ncbi:hypothetical protein IP88_16005 [alpha proteobacterium AAP81b]|nr:hypothetical protein IP88_16005 [alpha proteobacterium AAP81b]
MQLNIKDPETHRLVAELSEEIGVTKASAVKEAVREKLQRVRSDREADIAERLARLRELTAQMRARMPKPLPTQQELDDWMYDENGLPR